jgi:polygalacturonase
VNKSILIIAALLPAFSVTAQTGAKATKRFVISEFGAVADGKTVNTKAIQATIDNH